MSAPHLLIVAVDGLRAAALGAYGNTMCPTPALDEFAAGSCLFDWCYAPSAELSEVYQGLWRAVHPARLSSAMETAPSLPRLLSKCGYSTTLVTDAPELASAPLAVGFDQALRFAEAFAADTKPTRADDASQTELARLLAAASDAIATADSSTPQLVWVHARGMYGAWDAPLEMQQSLLDEDDLPPVETVAPPDLQLDEHADPDAAFRYGCAYAAQVMVLDAAWPGLLEATKAHEAATQWLVMLLGTRGFPLGEHRRIGGVDPRLYVEQLHVPWLIKFPDGRGRLARQGQLVSSLDLLPTVLELIDGSRHIDPAHIDGASILPLLRAARPAWRDALIASSDAAHRAIRTADWCLRQDAGAQTPELYVRPDDRWEFNDVAKLCPEETESLSRAMDQFLHHPGVSR